MAVEVEVAEVLVLLVLLAHQTLLVVEVMVKQLTLINHRLVQQTLAVAVVAQETDPEQERQVDLV